jgi:hypothetical protein
MCDHPGSECGRNGCGHTFCNTCWQSHLAVQIKEGKARHISCMAFKCGVVCDEELVLQVIQVRGPGDAAGTCSQFHALTQRRHRADFMSHLVHQHRRRPPAVGFRQARLNACTPDV